MFIFHIAVISRSRTKTSCSIFSEVKAVDAGSRIQLTSSVTVDRTLFKLPIHNNLSDLLLVSDMSPRSSFGKS